MSARRIVKISYGEDGYSDVYDAWVLNGESRQFDRQGDWGGAIYSVLDTSATYPDFYQIASLGPTVFDEESPAERPESEGWHLINRNYMRGKLKVNWEGRWSVEPPEVPNEL